MVGGQYCYLVEMGCVLLLLCVRLLPSLVGVGCPGVWALVRGKGKEQMVQPINRLCDFYVVRAVWRERGAVVPETICSERESDEERKNQRT